MKYEVYKVEATAPDDPPACGEVVRSAKTFAKACILADRVCDMERDPAFAYFVIPGGYSVGLMEVI